MVVKKKSSGLSLIKVSHSKFVPVTSSQATQLLKKTTKAKVRVDSMGNILIATKLRKRK